MESYCGPTPLDAAQVRPPVLSVIWNSLGALEQVRSASASRPFLNIIDRTDFGQHRLFEVGADAYTVNRGAADVIDRAPIPAEDFRSERKEPIAPFRSLEYRIWAADALRTGDGVYYRRGNPEEDWVRERQPWVRELH